MESQGTSANYGQTFENRRRLHPRIWDADYCLLRGLATEVADFADKHTSIGMTVIDIGCGAKPYRSLFPDKCEYIGVDTCENPHADLIIDSSEPIPFGDAKADCIFSTQVIYLIPEYMIYLRECRRLLKPEGRIFISTHGTWTYHPASGGDYYRFTHEGLKYILENAGFEVEAINPVVGTLGAGLHLRQLVFVAWLSKIPYTKPIIGLLNILTNLRILFDDKISPIGTKMSSPVILTAICKPRID